MEDRRRQEGHHRPQRQGRAELGKAQGPDVAQQVGQPQRFRNGAKVLEEQRPAGQVPQLLRLPGGHPGGEEVPNPSRIVEEGDHPVAGAGQRPGGVQDPLQHRVQVQALVDAEAGLAQPGQPVPQRLILLRQVVGVLQLFTSIGLWKARYSGLSRTGPMEGMDSGPRGHYARTGGNSQELIKQVA